MPFLESPMVAGATSVAPHVGSHQSLKDSLFTITNGILTSAYFVPAVLLLGLLFRLALLFLVRHSTPFADENDYRAIALSILQKHKITLDGAFTAFRPIGEPVFIAAVYRIVGLHVIAVKLLQELLLTALPLLCWRLSRELHLSLRAANLTALLVAFNPALAYATSTLYPTALTTVLLTAGILLSGCAVRHVSSRYAATGGLCLGLTGLCTSVFVPLPLLVGFVLLWKRYVHLAIIVSLLGLLPSGIWVMRNRLVLHTWTLATNGGMNLYLGANDEATGRSGNWITELPVNGGELVRDRVLGSRGEAWIRQHPLHWAGLAVTRAVLVLDSVGKPKTAGIHTGLAPKIVGWLMFPVTLLGVIGLYVFRRSPEIIFTSLAFALVVASSAVTIVKPRFRFPCDPLLTVSAVAVGSAAFVRKTKGSADLRSRLNFLP